MQKLLLILILFLGLVSCDPKLPVACGDPAPPGTPSLTYVDKNTGVIIINDTSTIKAAQPCNSNEPAIYQEDRDSIHYFSVGVSLHQPNNTSNGPCSIVYVTLNNMDTDTLEFIGDYVMTNPGDKDCPPTYKYNVSKVIFNGTEAGRKWLGSQQYDYNQYFELKK